jgi:hypothetical protein
MERDLFSAFVDHSRYLLCALGQPGSVNILMGQRQSRIVREMTWSEDQLIINVNAQGKDQIIPEPFHIAMLRPY